MSIAQDIAIALSARLALIDTGTRPEFATRIGLRVMRGRRRLDESMVPCVVIIEGDDTVTDSRGSDVCLTQRYVFEGHAACDPDNPNDTAHDIIKDLKRAIFKDAGDLESWLPFRVRSLRYVGRNIDPREDGLSIVSAAIEIEVTYTENLANP